MDVLYIVVIPVTADELLDARVARGWRPTASDLQSGPAILGHASCRAAQWSPDV